MSYELLIDKITEKYAKILKNNLVGIYIHGSIAFQCFNWNNSDIDFIVVVNDPISQGTKLQLLQVLEKLRANAPKKGFEMSIVLKKYCENLVYPTPYELHFSNSFLMQYDDIKIDYDLAAHFTVIKHIGIVAFGQPISDVFGEISKENYVDSIYRDIEASKKAVIDNPVYIILNLCRVYAYLKDGFILSKKQGGEWGLNNLPDCYKKLIDDSIKCYSSDINKEEIDFSLSIDFCEYMLKLIKGEIK